jgi:hypothetical protein
MYQLIIFSKINYKGTWRCSVIAAGSNTFRCCIQQWLCTLISQLHQDVKPSGKSLCQDSMSLNEDGNHKECITSKVYIDTYTQTHIFISKMDGIDSNI